MRTDDDALLERAALAIADDAQPALEDDELLAAIVLRTLEPRAAVPRALHRSRLRWVLPAAALLVVAGGAAAAITLAPIARRPVVDARAPETHALGATTAPPVASVALPSIPVESLPDDTTSPAAVPASAVSSAAEMFTAANDARRRGDPKAPTLYRDLQRAHPQSPEAHVSRVTLGRLYLDRLGDANAALAELDAYLASGGGELDEEAIVGRALALERLGRAAEERAAWTDLVARFPGSASEDRARARLADLERR